MRAEELRIGNWVTEKFVGKADKDIQILEKEMHDLIYGASEFWHPIPLTEEWLKRFGFKVINALHDGTSVFQRADSKTLYLHNSGCWISGASHVSCKYVHQLQNLYFALTGEEL